MSNIIPFPTQKTQKKKVSNKKEVFPFNWELSEGSITFTNMDGSDITIGFNPWETHAFFPKDRDYVLDLMFDLQEIVEKDPACQQYVCENLERLIRVLKK